MLPPNFSAIAQAETSLLGEARMQVVNEMFAVGIPLTMPELVRRWFERWDRLKAEVTP